MLVLYNYFWFFFIFYANGSSSYALNKARGYFAVFSRIYVPDVPKSVNFGIILAFNAPSTAHFILLNFVYALLPSLSISYGVICPDFIFGTR